MSVNDGFYLVFPDNGDPEVSFNVTVTLSPEVGPPMQVNGRLLFLGVRITDGVDTDPGKTGNEMTNLALRAWLNLGRGKVKLGQFFSGIEFGASGGAELRFAMVVDFSTISADFGTLLPSISVDLAVDMGIEGKTSGGLQVKPPVVVLGNVTLDLGSFISDYAGPILQKIDKVLAPLDWLIGPDGFLNKRIPLLSDVAGRKITGKDLILLFDQKHGPDIIKFLDFVEQLRALVKLGAQAAADARAAGSMKINFGDLLLTAGLRTVRWGSPDCPMRTVRQQEVQRAGAWRHHVGTEPRQR